jgi:[protein-PII] uridylyltransferase
VVRDFYHRYTVDEHTLVAIESLEQIEDDRFRELFNEIDRPDLLRFALLLHDIGKGTGNHVVVSQVMAREILKRVEAPEADAEIVLFLIAEHLALSNVMTSRDLGDPGTAVLIAERTGTIERLKSLALLTFADIGAVHPGALTPWRTEQLWRTYLAGYEELTRELATQRIHALDGASPEVATFVEGFPTRYQRTHTRAEILSHLELSKAAAKSGAAVEIQRLNGFFRATIAGPDHRGLFASLSGALAALGMNILKAEAFSNAAGQILDVFIFSDPHRTLELNPDETERLRHTLVRAAVGKEDVRRLLQRRPAYKPRPGRPDSKVLFDASAPATTRVEIVAEDRPGLLYDLSAALSAAGCDIDVVLIDTEGAKAIDVFYVSSNAHGLDAAHRETLRSALLIACSPDEKSSIRAGQAVPR